MTLSVGRCCEIIPSDSDAADFTISTKSKPAHKHIYSTIQDQISIYNLESNKNTQSTCKQGFIVSVFTAASPLSAR